MNLYKLGHRQRIFEKFLKNPEAFCLYEIIEICLMIIIPRKDVKETAKILASKYKRLSNICDSDKDDFIKTAGLGEKSFTFFRLLKKLSEIMLRDEVHNKTVFENKDVLQQYCKIKIQNSPVERMLILFLNQNGELMEEEILYEGTKNFISTYPREIIKHSLNIGADFIVLSHNHPSGNSSPSKKDIETTEKINDMCKAVNIVLYDHFIISANHCFSMREAGYITDLFLRNK
jgi:DNA repair protein RadC